MVCVFARKTSEPLASLVKKIDEKIGENSTLKAFVVVLTERTDKTTAAELKKLAANAGIKNVPLTLHQDPGGPADYEIARDADITVMMWKGIKVGEPATPFNVDDCTGPNKGTTLCYR